MPRTNWRIAQCLNPVVERALVMIVAMQRRHAVQTKQEWQKDVSNAVIVVDNKQNENKEGNPKSQKKCVGIFEYILASMLKVSLNM